MSEQQMKEKVSGVWNGKQVRFTRIWRGQRLTDEQCEQLLAGKDVVISGLISQRTGKPYDVIARLAELTSKDGQYKFVGVDQVDYVKRKRGVPVELCQHKFTEDERIMLESGKTVEINDFVSGKTGNKFGCKVRYNEAEDKIDFDFNR